MVKRKSSWLINNRATYKEILQTQELAFELIYNKNWVESKVGNIFYTIVFMDFF